MRVWVGSSASSPSAAAPTSLAVQADPSAVPVSGTTTLSGRLTAGGLPVAGARIDVLPSDEVEVAHAVTGADGSWSTVASFPWYVTGAELRAVHVGGLVHQRAVASAFVSADGSGPIPPPPPPPAAPAPTTTTLAAPAQSTVGTLLQVLGRVATSTGGLAAVPVAVARDGCGTTSPSWPATTDADGGFAVTDSPPAGTCRYTASFVGSTTTGPSSATATTSVAKRATSLTVSAVRTDRKTVRVTAQLGLTANSRVVTITARPAAGGATTTLASAVVGADGRLTLTHATRVATVYTATFAGDAGSLPATATATV